jgi:hypothetical protein
MGNGAHKPSNRRRNPSALLLTVKLRRSEVVTGTGMLGIMFFLHRCAQICTELLQAHNMP